MEWDDEIQDMKKGKRARHSVWFLKGFMNARLTLYSCIVKMVVFIFFSLLPSRFCRVQTQDADVLFCGALSATIMRGQRRLQISEGRAASSRM